jgi:hypothetical protein
MKKFVVCFLMVCFFIPVLCAVQTCPYCGYRQSSNAIECSKCLKLLKWPYVPERSHKARVVVRTGKDAFIRHPSSQNRNFKSEGNAGSDAVGAIGSWGFMTGLRYLVCFDIKKSFELAGVDLKSYQPGRVILRLVIADSKIDQAIPVRVFPLLRPFKQGRGFRRIRRKEIDGCTWNYSAPMLSWHVPGGDFYKSVSASNTLGRNGKREVLIDVTPIYRFRFKIFAETGEWFDPGMIIMRDERIAGHFTFLNIYSFENKPAGCRILSPQLFFD